MRKVNNLLREHLPSGCYFVDLEQVSGTIGRQRFYDPRRYFWTKQPFSDDGIVRLAEHLWSGLRATLTGPKKVLVLDLDNTLWGGVVGETGPLGIDVGDTPAGEAHRDFQRLAKELADRGSLIAVCSKNNPEDAREPFEVNSDMVLGLDDIVAFEAGWKPKHELPDLDSRFTRCVRSAEYRRHVLSGVGRSHRNCRAWLYHHPYDQ